MILVKKTSRCVRTNHGAIVRRNNFLGPGRQLHTGSLGFGVVSNDGSIIARCTGKSTTVSMLLLHIANNGTFRHGANRQDIADLKGSYRNGQLH